MLLLQSIPAGDDAVLSVPGTRITRDQKQAESKSWQTLGDNGGHNTSVICDHLQDNMHFSVPDTVELKDKSGSNYLVSIQLFFVV